MKPELNKAGVLTTFFIRNHIIDKSRGVTGRVRIIVITRRWMRCYEKNYEWKYIGLNFFLHTDLLSEFHTFRKQKEF